MGLEAIVAALIAIAGSAGGYYGGRRGAVGQSVEIANNTVALLRSAIEELERQNDDKESRIAALDIKVEVLESMVTQRAEVGELREEVQGVRVTVDRIANKIGA